MYTQDFFSSVNRQLPEVTSYHTMFTAEGNATASTADTLETRLYLIKPPGKGDSGMAEETT